MRAKVLTDISLEPHTVLKKGEKGTVVHMEEDIHGVYEAEIRMDNFHAGLAEWDNTAHLVEPELSAVAFKQQFPAVNLSLPATFTLGGLAVLGMVELVQAVEGVATHFF